MDDLWDPPNYQATEEIRCGKDGYRCGFCLSYVLHQMNPVDVIKEKDLNEKSCIQVLRILISKADTEIVELEKELTDLLIQLAYTNEEFSNIFYKSLQLKTDILDLSIRKLKDNHGDFLSISREPAESLNDIIKSIFCGYLRKKDQRLADNTNIVAGSSCQVNPFGEKKQMERTKRVIITGSEKHTISHIRVKIEEDYPESIHDFGATTLNNVQETGLLKLNRFQIVRKDVPKKRCKKPSSETQEEWKHELKRIKCQCQTDDESIGPRSSRSQESSSKQPNPIPKNTITEVVPFLDNKGKSNSKLPNTKMLVKQELMEGDKNANLSTRTYSRRHKVSKDSDLHVNSEKVSSLEMDSYYTLHELRAIAKERSIRGYTKLQKSVLAELLGIKVNEGKRNQKRKVPLVVLKDEP